MERPRKQKKKNTDSQLPKSEMFNQLGFAVERLSEENKNLIRAKYNGRETMQAILGNCCISKVGLWRD